MKRLILAFSLVLPTLLSAPVHAEDMPEPLRGKGCTFYEKADKQGEKLRVNVDWKASEQPGHRVVYGQSMAQLGDWWNDRIASISCDNNTFSKPEVQCEATVYTDANFKGGFFSHKGWERDVRNLKQKTGSSVKVLCSLYSN